MDHTVCGIAGILELSGQPADAAAIQAMTDALVHRGPDDEGFYLDGPVGLGFRRLSIIDVAGGHQPLANEDGSVWIVFNGEIYNFKELRVDLAARGHHFRTQTDTEVIVHLYEEYGEGCLDRLRGMFALAVWDGRRRQLFLARDPFGIKPLYYSCNGRRLLFGSEIKCLLEVPGVEREVDRESFWHYLTFQYVPEPRTMFQGVQKLPPGHLLVARGGSVEVKRYFSIEFSPQDKPVAEFADELLACLRGSVRVHMNSDVPRGAFLSSGVDSSAIVALLRELEDVQTFTVGFEGAGGQSEIAYARQTADALKTRHRDTVVTADRYWNALPRLVFQQDEPVADPSAIALHFVAELASQYVTVVLSGEGADEIFGGYTIYREPMSLRMFDCLSPGLRGAVGEAAGLLPEGMRGRGFLIRGSKSLRERFFGNAFLFGEREKALFVTSPAGVSSLDVTGALYDRIGAYDPVSQMQYIDLHTWLPGNILMKADKMTMGNSLELRVPFLDKEVFALAARIPVEGRLQGGTTKYVLREAVKRILPPAVARRPKLGFPVPTRRWLREDHYAAARELIGDSGGGGGLFDRAYALRLLDEHRDGVRDNARKVWAVVIFVLWWQIYIEGSRPFRPRVSDFVRNRRERMPEGARS